MVIIAIILFIISLVLLSYSIALLIGRDGSLFSLFSKEEKSATKAEKLSIYLATLVILTLSVIMLLQTI
ncbi:MULTISPECIES: hypothetical protein [Staphylococcus]|uniref:Uncharacterized protein n=1 Tax=Staphylococcus arlettae TaxID=29378 RepID=A0A380BYN8_9STAP|nr:MULTISPECIES: hypothetical protein [Staphylococcus]EJY96869.1 hypothetical protein SARL_00200 [Staphylococcus arlettae CVD059]MCD8838866.1 hypothetical protein [Staphylococcus arlettae]MCD8866064.1 hypothetical protein [Staphylococcus arlettae]MCD8889007.1 hypothetical protein [Staphylococcus arlettae]MCD9055563.1 hypothetical protein [Staphylococcus arlettae]